MEVEIDNKKLENINRNSNLLKYNEEDLFLIYKQLQNELNLLEIQEEFILEETKNLKLQYLKAKEEIKVIQSTPLMIGQFNEMIDENYGIVTSTTGQTYCSRVLSTINREELKILLVPVPTIAEQESFIKSIEDFNWSMAVLEMMPNL